MPYIDKMAREYIDNGGKPGTYGELNYAITKLCQQFYDRTEPHYAEFNGVIGVLECCKQELYRRVVAPYEDLKISENGDVYE